MKRRIILAYLVLLALSYAVRFASPGPEAAVRNARLDLIEWGAPSPSPGAAIVLIGDSDGAGHRFDRFGPELADRSGLPVQVAQMPGIDGAADGAISREPSAQAALLCSQLEASGEGPRHLLGYGYGGAVALEASRQRPDLVRSVALVSVPVSAKYALLGDPRLNRAMKGFRLAWTWFVQRFAPHFGLLDRGRFGLASAQADFAIDFDVLSRSFTECSVPLFLAAADGELRVPPEALEAFGAARPGSAVHSYAGGRSDLFDEAAPALARDYGAFLRRVSDPDGTVVGSADIAAGTPFEELPGLQLNPWLAAGLLAIATFASEDLACIGGGLLAGNGSISLEAAIAGCLIGIFVGDFFIYLVGRLLGASALDLPFFRGLARPETLARCARWFDRRGVSLIVLTRFLPGSRVPTYFAAGVVKVGAARFGLALLIASAVWTPILVGIAYWAGPRFLALFEGFGAMGWIGIATLAICFVLLTRLIGSLLTWRGRRLLLSRWRRLTNWEFWPAWALYPPVVAYIAWLMLRYRSATLPSAVNPCMSASGLVFESKSQILRHLRDSGAPVARFEVIELEQPIPCRLRRLQAFMSQEGLGFPIVLKPDVGQRGQGVAIVRGMGEAEAFFEAQKEDTIAQEYIGGVEYGVFYERSIRAASGRVTSITDKRLTSVRGDGRSTLEQLILRDRRAVCMAAYFLRQFETELDRIPANGESVPLTVVGTHCRGALFLDGEEFLTPALEKAVDAFSAPVAGFHFGRYDIRAPSAEAFGRGEGLRIIELNGLTSEPTSMYDPRHSLFFAWRTLMRQWARIFELAEENRRAGHEPDSVKALARLVRAHLRGATSKDLF